MKISLTVTELWHIQECLEKSKGHNLETKKRGTTILCVAYCSDPIHIPMKLHKDIPCGTFKNGWKKNQRGITWKLRKREQSFLCVTHLDLIYIPIKLHEDIHNGY